MPSLCMAWMSRGKPSTIPPSYQLPGNPSLSWWNSSSALPSIETIATEAKIRQEQSSSPGSFFSGWQWFFLADGSAWEASVKFQACFIARLPFYSFRGWEQDERQWEHKLRLRVSRGHKVLRPCRTIISKQKHTLILCTLTLSCGKVMRDQYHGDPQIHSLFRIAFVSCSELDRLKPWR